MSQTTSDPNDVDLAEVWDLDIPHDASQLTDLIEAPSGGAAHLAVDGGVADDAADDQPALPGPIPPVILRRRTVSGRYRSTSGGFQLELRVDVDGTRSVGRVSGDYYATAGSTTSYFGSWILHAPSVTITATSVVVEGVASCTWSTTFTRARITMPRTLIFQPPGKATLTWSNAAGTQGATYVAAWEASAFRTVLWEQDSVTGTVPFVSYNTGSLPQPVGSPARTLSVVAAFAEAGIQMLTAGVPNVITNTLSGADTRWDEAELHAAMQANFSLWANAPQWQVYSLIATRFRLDGVRGIMYDAADTFPRQGMAVFHDAVQGTSADSQRAQLRTYVHELGHCFNLLHSWEKNLATPPQSLGPNGGLGDLSWMNYAWKFQPPLPAPGGEAAYWAAFPFQFTPNELVHLRHGFRPDVIMGGSAFGTGAGDIDPDVFADRSTDHSGLALELRAPRSFALGEPVVVELKLSSTTRSPVRTHGRLHPRDGLVQIAVQDPSGGVQAYRPLMPLCVDSAPNQVLSDEQPALYESAYIGYGADGFTFEQAGTYRLRAVYVADDGSRVVSPTLSLRVRSPHTAADDDVAELLMADGQGELLYLLGSDAPVLAGANAAMEELLAKHPKHPMAVFARLVTGVNDERTFKTVKPDKALELRPARPADAVRNLKSVVAASTGDGGVDNITLNMVIRHIARAEAEAGDIEKATATLDALPAPFKKKGIKPQVLEVIEAEAQEEKARLLAEVEGAG